MKGCGSVHGYTHRDGASTMKMVVITFRRSLEPEVLSLLEKMGIHAYTEIPKVHGIGEAGPAFGSFAFPGENIMILLALPRERAYCMIEAFEALRDRLTKQQHDAKIPMKLFVLPCEKII
jgi:hypothetical protein